MGRNPPADGEETWAVRATVDGEELIQTTDCEAMVDRFVAHAASLDAEAIEVDGPEETAN